MITVFRYPSVFNPILPPAAAPAAVFIWGAETVQAPRPARRPAPNPAGPIDPVFIRRSFWGYEPVLAPPFRARRQIRQTAGPLDALAPPRTVPPVPVIPAGGASDDDGCPWWDTSCRNKEEQERLARMRREIGLLPPAARSAVSAAAQRLIAAPQALQSQSAALKAVRLYERAYLKALSDRLSATKAKALWKEALRRKLVEQEEEDLLLLAAEWLI